jgi:phosphatidylserine/phosphatidylglycerophosphate/cardiolipin synthase-like enzyme
MHARIAFALIVAVSLGAAAPAAAQDPPPQVDRLCDSAFENCRGTLLDLIRSETVSIDVAFWFMEDKAYTDALIAAKRRGVSIRVLMDTKANTSYPLNKKRLAELVAGGIPMRERSGDYLHWKLMLFGGQNVLQFSGANYSAEAFNPISPYVNYVDEIIVFTTDVAVVNSFRSKYDDIWTRTSGYKNYANVSGPLTRRFPPFPIDPELNFPTTGGTGSGDFAVRSVGRYNAETVGIDSIIYRIDDDRHTNALIAAIERGIPVRLITEQLQYRDVKRYKHSFNVDRLYMAGVQVRFRGHTGMTHEKLTVLHGQQMAVFGSSNWTISSANSQLEHNYFTHKFDLYEWTTNHFERKWNNLGPSPETKAFVPLPPDAPTNKQPANAVQNQPLSIVLRWYGGPWAWYYDVYFGTDPMNLELLPERTHLPLGPSPTTSTTQSYAIGGLQPATTYYWKVVSRTAANLEKSGPGERRAYLQQATEQIEAGHRAGGAGRLLRDDVHGQGGRPLQAVDPRQGRQQLVQQRLGVRPVLGFGDGDEHADAAHRHDQRRQRHHRGVRQRRPGGMGLGGQPGRRRRCAGVLRDRRRPHHPDPAARGRDID